MKRWFGLALLFLAGLCLVWLAGCAPAAHPTTPAVSEPTLAAPTTAAAVEGTPAPSATPSSLPEATQAVPATQPTVEQRVIELEWPERLRMGESDIVRLALVPGGEAYVASVEFPEHPLSTQEVSLPRPPGYNLVAVARLDGVGFLISPSGDLARLVPPGESVSWRWSLSPRASGQQRLTVSLLLRWEPEPAGSGPVRESAAFGRGLDVQIDTFLGMGRSGALATGLGGLTLGAALGLFALLGRRLPPRAADRRRPNRGLIVEQAPGMSLTNADVRLLQVLFNRYKRLVLEQEFLSGYSGARTFLARPLLPNGNADATTIVKVARRDIIEQEFDHYERFVKHRLPPVTARIQQPPVVLHGSANGALQYTCIAEPGKAPLSLRQALLANPDPGLIHKLFETFGPNWWMQRQPYSFRLGVEYDRVLPPHLALTPVGGTSSLSSYTLDQDTNPAELVLRAGELVMVTAFQRSQLRDDGRSFTLTGRALGGQPALRLRWMDGRLPNNTVARIVSSRRSMLAEQIGAMEDFGLLNPLDGLEDWLQETVAGTRSTIHGDLNPENVLVGSGGLVWLIDFAETREGHPLFDFAHLAAQLIAHVIAPQASSPMMYLQRLQLRREPLLSAVEEVARACLFDANVLREYQLGLAVACLGALKHRNLSSTAKQCLFLTAAFYAGKR